MSLHFTWLICFSWLDWGYGFWQEGHWGKVPSSSHHIKGAHNHRDLSLMMLTLFTCWSNARQCRVEQCPPFPDCALWKGLSVHSLYLSYGELSSAPWAPWGERIYINYLESFSTRDLSNISPLGIHNVFIHYFLSISNFLFFVSIMKRFTSLFI